jgi:hypothetical protein
MEWLERRDIVGKKLTDVRRSPWMAFEGVFYCNAFVMLENGIAFQFNNLAKFNDAPPLAIVDGISFSKAPRPENWAELSAGIEREIKEVVVSPNLSPCSVGLWLCNDLMICYYDRMPNVCEIILADPYKISLNFRTYWGKQRYP